MGKTARERTRRHEEMIISNWLFWLLILLSIPSVLMILIGLFIFLMGIGEDEHVNKRQDGIVTMSQPDKIESMCHFYASKYKRESSVKERDEVCIEFSNYLSGVASGISYNHYAIVFLKLIHKTSKNEFERSGSDWT